MSMPPWERAREAAVRFPSRVRVSVTPKAECRGVEWFSGVTAWVNGRRTLRAVYSDDGIFRGRVERNGTRTEGVDACSDLGRC